MVNLRDELATLSLRLDKSGVRPLYLQLADQLRQLINNARLHPGDRLPSSRRLAEELGISRTSALNAYDQLIAEGLLITRPASGVFVSAIEQAVTTPTDGTAHCQSGLGRPGASIEAAGLFDAGPDIDQFPFDDWARCLSRVWRRPDPGLLRDRHPGGYWPLRQAISRYLKVMRDIQVSPEQVIVTAGNRDALSLIATVLLQTEYSRPQVEHSLLQTNPPSQTNSTVWLEDPGYPQLRQGLMAAGAKLEYCPVDEHGMTLPAAGAPGCFAWMTPARQYPLGVNMSTQRRLDWLSRSREDNFWLVEDDYDSEFHYRKAPAAPLFNLDHQQQVILVGSFSKVMFRTLRIGYLLAPERLVEPLLAAQHNLGTLASMPVQPALAEFLEHRRFASHLRRMKRCYQQRRDYLFELLETHLGDSFCTELPDRGMHLVSLLDSGVGVTDYWLEQQLADRQVHVSALSSHYKNANVQGLLLGFSGSSEQQLLTGVKILKELLRDSS
ncbi:PLP-dependent aminotransferase family protein [Motiliproteus sp. MSK22-1]|uniref:MocR-like pyridoxine biosynthesis transcription factor PdxR n=1 Tax=Motiliproteus sp. MSK22-1 TaxID=1897630 RepID=UPI001300DD2F|nr:PLP-dependent aminotransferase family protein [Motiliproteus sp. MSK22-1]